MIKIGSRTGHKIGILLVLTTLAIGSTAAVSWNNPENGEVLTGDSNGNYKLNITESGSSLSVYWDDGTLNEVDVSQNGDYWTGNWDTNNAGTGDYTLVANASSDLSNANNISVTVDNNDPGSFSLDSPSSFTSSDRPDIEVSAEDSTSNIQNITVYLKDSNGNVVNSETCNTDSSSVSCTVEPGEDLSSGDTYDVNATAYDEVGNEGTSTGMSFTVDTSYDGDSNPSFSVEDESDGVVRFNDDKDLTVDFGDADSTSDTTVTCYVGGEDVGDFTVDANDDNPDESDTTCRIDDDDNEDYYDSSAEIYLEMKDEAGNTVESDSETVSFDANPPSVTGLQIPTNASLYNSNFDVKFTAYDSASEVEEVEYYFDSSTSYGEGTGFESVVQDNYEIDTGNLSAGDHTLYVRAQDEANRWSLSRTVDFSFDPDAVPEISLDVPENVSVTAGEQGSFDVTVENTGKLHISNIELSGSAEGVFSVSQNISDLQPGESITTSLDIDTEASNIGEHNIEVSTDSPSMTEEIDLVVEANSEQQSRIDSDLSEHQSKLQEMETNVTDLKQKVSEDKKQRLDSNFSKFKQKIEDAQSAVDRGDYYEAEAILEGIDQDESAAETTYEAVQKEYKNNQFWMLIFLGLGGLVVLGGGAIGAASYSDEVDFDIRDYLEDLQEIEFDTSSLEKSIQQYVDKIKQMTEGKGTSGASSTSDTESFEWEGFDNN